LALLNSRSAGELLHIVNSTVNFQVGDLGLLPVPERLEELSPLVAEAIKSQKKLDRFDETSTDFVSPPAWREGREISRDLNERLTELERRIDAGVAELYGLEDEEKAEVADAEAPTVNALARSWISFAMRIWLAQVGRAIRLTPLDRETRGGIMGILESNCGMRGAGEIAVAVGGLEKFLTGPFYSWHVKQFEGRPIWWAFNSGEQIWLVPQELASARMLRECGVECRAKWRRNVDAGTLANLAPLMDSVADAALRRGLARWRERHDSSEIVSRVN